VPERGSRRREEDIGETWPDLPEWATADALDLEVRRDLRGLSKEGADWVAAHLVAAGTLADDEPEEAWRHARAARARGGRIGVVRETVGLVAYRAGEWAEAIGELRAARRMGGGPGHLAVMADCERALGHPERAIELSRSAEADDLDPDAAAELSIVVAGARADLGQIDAALAHLERIGLDKAEEHPRLAYAYADLLLQAGRRPEALTWFIRSANSDADEETDALDRVEALSLEAPDLGQAPDLDQAPDLEQAGLEQAPDVDVIDTEDVEVVELDESTSQELIGEPSDKSSTKQGPTERETTEGTTEQGTTEPETIEPSDFLGDDDLEFKPASAASATVDDSEAAHPSPAITDDSEVPSLLFSDDPQAGDR
jgi:tetratricopeptide (TPR) repeat protein